MIEHGVPKHDYFAIAQPLSVVKPTVDELLPEYVKPILDFKDPKTNKKYQAELHGTFTYELRDFEQMNSFCLIIYGIESKKLLKVLEKKYPEIAQTQKVRFLVLKKI